MPSAGFKSITVTELVYDNFFAVWLKCKDDMAPKGVSSFAGFITYLIEDCLERNRIFTKYTQEFEKIAIEKNRIILKDNSIDRVIELSKDKDVLSCKHCERNNCVHVGFCWSFPEIYG